VRAFDHQLLEVGTSGIFYPVTTKASDGRSESERCIVGLWIAKIGMWRGLSEDFGGDISRKLGAGTRDQGLPDEWRGSQKPCPPLEVQAWGF